MKKLFLLSAILCFLFQADGMNHKKKKRKKVKTTTTVTKTTTVSSAVDTVKSKPGVLVVSFISTGSGIDFRAVPEFEGNLKKFNIDNHCNVIYEIKNWGREGERDYCITARDASCLKKYIAEIKTAFKENDKIIIKENSKCRE